MRDKKELLKELSEVQNEIKDLVIREEKHKTRYVDEYNSLIRRERNLHININQINQKGDIKR